MRGTSLKTRAISIKYFESSESCSAELLRGITEFLGGISKKKLASMRRTSLKIRAISKEVL